MPPEFMECGRLIPSVQGRPRARHCSRPSGRDDPMPAHAPAAFREQIAVDWNRRRRPHQPPESALLCRCGPDSQDRSSGRCAQSRARAGRLWGRRFGGTGGADSQRAQSFARTTSHTRVWNTNFQLGRSSMLTNHRVYSTSFANISLKNNG